MRGERREGRKVAHGAGDAAKGVPGGQGCLEARGASAERWGEAQSREQSGGRVRRQGGTPLKRSEGRRSEKGVRVRG